MMTQAFYSGLSGLRAGQTAIDITANNISNISTTGFRAYKAEFSNLFEDAMVSQGGDSLNPSSVGIGTQIQASSMVLGNGSYSLSERSTDMALDGAGWFGVSNPTGNFYTRAGNFMFDSNSNLVTSEGYHVLGTMGGNIDFDSNTITDVVGEVGLGDIGEVEKLSFPQTLTYPSIATTSVKFFGNIGIEDEVRTMGADIVDAQGNLNYLNLSFSKSNPQVQPGTQWDVTARTENSDGSIVYDSKTGSVKFDSDGLLISSSLTTIDNNGSAVEIGLGSSYNGITAIGNTEITSSSMSDGSIGGDLVGYDINSDAEVVATFSNGYQSSVGQIAVFHFRNDQGLDRASGANFMQSVNSGDPFFMQDESGNNISGAKVMTYKLENSNVAMEQALTELIVYQRSYDANSKSVSTANEMMQKALEMDA
ncbi:MAG: flagellar hook-basal body complex protein [Thiovulaceae bacterium]|nr:flagellar hook-basal body complex protein [Sulfurimonadaceae bacterium]